MAYRVTVQPAGNSFLVQDNETILDAALRCGYFFPHNCRMGVCTACKGKVLEGEIEYENEILGLGEEEQQSGCALFCSAKPKGDIVIYVKDFASTNRASPKLMTYHVIANELIAKDISRIILKAPEQDRVHYQAGQYIKVMHHDQRISPMSIACAPFDLSVIEIHLAHPIQNSQACDLFRIVHSEKQLILRGPYGTSTASKMLMDRPIIFVANGTGFGPVKAVIEELLSMKKHPVLHLYWYGNPQEEFYMQELVSAWCKQSKTFQFTKVVSDSIELLILQDYPELSDYQVYAVDMENAVYSMLFTFMQNGLSREWFYSDVLDYNPMA
jgi:CDP-4-dehydro-6-deoxyglucose reductase